MNHNPASLAAGIHHLRIRLGHNQLCILVAFKRVRRWNSNLVLHATWRLFLMKKNILIGDLCSTELLSLGLVPQHLVASLWISNLGRITHHNHLVLQHELLSLELAGEVRWRGKKCLCLVRLRTNAAWSLFLNYKDLRISNLGQLDLVRPDGSPIGAQSRFETVI